MDGLAHYMASDNTITSYTDKKTVDNPHRKMRKKKAKRCKPGKKVDKAKKAGI